MCKLKSSGGLLLFLYLSMEKSQNSFISAFSLSFSEFEGGIDSTGEDEAIRN